MVSAMVGPAAPAERAAKRFREKLILLSQQVAQLHTRALRRCLHPHHFPTHCLHHHNLVRVIRRRDRCRLLQSSERALELGDLELCEGRG